MNIFDRLWEILMIPARAVRRTFQKLKIVHTDTSTTSTTTSQTPIPDSTPDAFTLTDVFDVALSTFVSATMTVAGIDVGVSVSASVSGDASTLVRKNGGSWVAGPVSCVLGDTIGVGHFSSASNLTVVSSTLTVGGVSDTFTSTTVAASGTAGQSVGLLLAITKAS